MTVESMSATPGRARPFDRVAELRLAINWEVAFYALIFAAAIALRWWDLGSRALHHDESIHAQWSWRLMQGDYKHDPIFHGPFYYHLQGLVFLLFGTNDYTSRVSAAIFGTALVALPLLLRRRLGAVGTMAAVAFIAFSPTLVYYSRFFREDIYMAGFTLLMVGAMWRYLGGARDRWLVAFALAFTGSVATKEATYLTAAVFLVFLDILLSADLARRMAVERGDERPTFRLLMTAAIAPFAWVFASFWPFLPTLRRRMDWGDGLPRSGDMLVVLGTLTLPLLTAYLKIPLEHLGYAEKTAMVCGSTLTARDGTAIAGLFMVTVSGAAFVGLNWRSRTWAIAGGLSALAYLTLYTSLWTNLDGLCTGPWGSLDYWRTQQHVYRGEQPWYYYNILLPAYEFLPLVIAIGGFWWSFVRGNAFSRFLWLWIAGFYLGLSWGSEKMPWLNTHLTLPTCLLAAWTINRAWSAWRNPPAPRVIALPLGSAAAVALGALALIAFMPMGGAYTLLRVAIAAAAVALVVFSARPYGRAAAATFACVAVVGALSLFSLRTMVQASFTRGDVPKDMLIYTQSSPDIPRLMSDISALAEATGLGYQLPIAVDSTDSFSWPWAWYLRDYKRVSYVEFTNGPPEGDFQVLLVNAANAARTNDRLAAASGTLFGSPQKYPHRWWFEESYKDAMRIDAKSGICQASSGNCGPYRLATWQTVAEGIFQRGWLKTWFYFWRDHDPDDIRKVQGTRECNTCGSVDAYAYFPANFDLQKHVLKPASLEAPKPVVDGAGRPMFGGLGRQPGQFFAPVDIEADAQGNLYVIDSATRKLQKFDAAGNFIAGVDIRVNPADAREESQPWGLGIAPNGDIIVADTFGWRVRGFDSDLKPTGLTFGTPPGKPGEPVGPYQLYGPRDIAFDKSGNMWVTDTGNQRIAIYRPNGEFVRAVGGVKGKGPGQFDEPVSISAAPDGSGFAVADMFNARVVLLDADGNYKGEFPVSGWGGKEVNDKPYIRYLRDGRLAVSLPAVNQVRVYDRTGAVAGTVTAPEEPLTRPYGIVEAADGKLWIVEGGASRVRQFPVP